MSSYPPSYRLEAPHGKYAFGIEKFYDTAVNPELPNFTETYGTTPTLPKPLLGENDYLGKLWNADYHARTHRGILGPLTVQYLTESNKYSWTKVEFHPGRARPAILGETPEIISMTQSFYEGSLQGAVPTGIRIPRGLWEKGIEAFTLWWNVQLNYLYDSLEIFAQGRIYYRILNNPDPLKYYIRIKKRPPTGYTVEKYLKDYVNPCVNCFRKLEGWRRFYLFDQKMMRIYYPSRLSDGRDQNWIFLVSPESDEHARFYKQENLLYLYSGNQRKEYPYVNMKDYSPKENNPKFNKDAVYPIPNFNLYKHETLGKNILSRNSEFPRYYRFLPFNMLMEEKKDLDSYDIFIIDDKQKKINSRVKYVDAVKAFDLDKIPSLFKLSELPNDKQNFHELVKKTIVSDFEDDDDDDNNDFNIMSEKVVSKVVKEIKKGRVRNHNDYYRYMLDRMEVDEVVQEVKANIDNKDKLIKSYEKFLKRINPLVEFITTYGDFGDKKKEYEKYIKLFFTILRVKNILNVGFTDDDITKVRFLKVLDSFKDLSPTHGFFTAAVKLFKDFTKKDILNDGKTQNKIFGRIFSKINFKSKKFREIAEKLLDLKIDMPFGIFLFKRQVYLTDSTVKVRRKSVDQLTQKLLATVQQEPQAGEIVVSVWKSFGERVKEIRDIKVYEDTYIKDSVLGGENSFWKLPKKKNIQLGSIKTFKYGSIWVVPVTLNEVLSPRINMINRNGFDDISDWDEVLNDLQLRKKETPYYSTWNKVCELYKWNNSRKGLHNAATFFFNNNLIKFRENHWAGWQKYCYDNDLGEDPERGKFEGHHMWWETESPIMNVRNVKESQI